MSTSLPATSAPTGTAASGITIRPLHAWDEYLSAEELERVVWRMPDWRDSVPANLLITAAKNGGAVLGAFDGSQLVGLAFSFLGLDSHFDPPILKHTSHMLAVLPEYQSRRIGAQLKLRQREFVLSQNIALMTWTYDPLLALNANLNIGRLGAIARRYVSDAYGEMTDGLNAGLASDRFEVEWWLDSARVREHLTDGFTLSDWDALIKRGAKALVSASGNGAPSLNSLQELSSATETLIVQVPVDLVSLKTSAPELARQWRMTTRHAFQEAFAAGYAATDFVLTRSKPAGRAAYVLTRAPVN